MFVATPPGFAFSLDGVEVSGRIGSLAWAIVS
jgi:hypothetical protein